MLENWRNWCRLCAKMDFGDEVCKMENSPEHLEMIKTHFSNNLYEVFQQPICDDCSAFLGRFTTFREQCLKVEQMFHELSHKREISDEDLQAIRIKFTLETEFILERFSVPFLQQSNENVEQTTTDDFVYPEDPLEFECEPNIVVKEEQFEVQAIEQPGDDVLSQPSIGILAGPPPLVFAGPPPLVLIRRDQDPDMPVEKKTPKAAEPGKKRGRKCGEKICDICSKTFTRFDSLKNHIMIHHSQNELPYVCSKCPKRFVKSSILKIHERSHLPDEEKLLHACPLCEKKFTTKGGVKVHLQSVHTNEKFFMCEDCGKSFKTKTALNEHRLIHSTEYPFQCSFCEKKFKNSPAKKVHEETHTDTKFTCPTCGLQLNTKRTLRLHMVVHSDAKKYKCNYCGNEYKRGKTLKDHLLLHTGQRPYECPFCDKTFTTGSNCRSHKKKEHPAELAALEASGKQCITNLPKLHELQSNSDESSDESSNESLSSGGQPEEKRPKRVRAKFDVQRPGETYEEYLARLEHRRARWRKNQQKRRRNQASQRSQPSITSCHYSSGESLSRSGRVEEKRPVSRPTGRPVDRPTGRPVSRPTGRPVDRPVDRPTARPVDRPVDKPTGRPKGRSAGRPKWNVQWPSETHEEYLARLEDRRTFWREKRRLYRRKAAARALQNLPSDVKKAISGGTRSSPRSKSGA